MDKNKKQKLIEEYSNKHEKLIRESYEKCMGKPQSDYLSRRLSISIAEWLLGSEVNADADELPEMPNERFITLMEFAIKYPGLCHPSYLSRHFIVDAKFLEWCGKKEKTKWYVQPKRALHYLAKHAETMVRKKAKKLIEE